MVRHYQHALTGARVEVKTLAEDDFYAEASVWVRVAAASKEPEAVEPVAKPAQKVPAKS